MQSDRGGTQKILRIDFVHAASRVRVNSQASCACKIACSFCQAGKCIRFAVGRAVKRVTATPINVLIFILVLILTLSAKSKNCDSGFCTWFELDDRATRWARSTRRDSPEPELLRALALFRAPTSGVAALVGRAARHFCTGVSHAVMW